MRAMTPEAVALAYLRAFERKDRAAVRALLADDVHVVGPLRSFTQADAFLQEAEMFMQLTKTFTVKKTLADGEDVCVFWDYATIVASIPVLPIAEWFKVAAGKIKFIQLHFNAAPLIAAMERGDIAKALQAQGAG